MTKERKYHHGNLKETFLSAARELLEQEGLAGLSLRKCAEKVGVSHTAPKNHFGNVSGLLTALVSQGYGELAHYMTEGIDESAKRSDRRKAALLGYVRFAQDNPALYELMFSRNRYAQNDPALMQEVKACFAILADISIGLDWHSGNDVEQAGKGQVALWSFVHGYAQLITADRLKKENMQGLNVLDILPLIALDDED